LSDSESVSADERCTGGKKGRGGERERKRRDFECGLGRVVTLYSKGPREKRRGKGT
jgi:hypothetical protein